MLMNWRRFGQFGLLFGAILVANRSFASTYYISTSSGSDSNTSVQAQSKSTPWTHLPGMLSCTSNCAAYSPVAGDQFILKGCDVWGNANFEIEWHWSGSSGNPIYIGVDQTWYNSTNCPLRWNRPIFDGQGALVTTNVANGNSNPNDFFDLNADYITIDNIEWRGGLSSNTCCGTNRQGFISTNLSNGTDIKNNYMHGWTFADSYDHWWCINSYSGDGYNTGQVIEYNVIDGSDTPDVQNDPGGANCSESTGSNSINYLNCKVRGSGLWYGPNVHHNILRYLSTAFVGNAQYFHDNLIEYIWVNGQIPYSTAPHENGFESLGDACATGGFFYNNVIRHVWAGVNFWGIPQPGCSAHPTSYYYDNISYDTPFDGNTFDIAHGGDGTANNVKVLNNTWACGPESQGETQTCSTPAITVSYENNHWVGSSSVGLFNCSAPCSTNSAIQNYGSTANFSETDDLQQTLSTANGQSYSSSETFAYSPVIGGSTIGNGTNLSSLCSANPNLAALCYDTTYACSYNTVNHTAVCPARTPNARPSSGPWDVGAFQFASGTAPTPPAGLGAIVH